MTRRGDSDSLSKGSQLLVEVSLPFQRMVTFPVRELQGLWDEYIALVEVREQNTHLRSKLSRLEEENLQYREAIVASERFQRLPEFRERRDVPMVPANVVAQDLSAWFQSIVIDQGSNGRIRPGMPVLTDTGVVGVVTGTSPRASKVLLVTDPQSHIDAYVQRTRARGTVRGGASNLAEFDYVLREQDVQVGDVLLTSGLGSVFPKSLVIGRISDVQRDPFGLFMRAPVESAVDFRRLEEVFVVLEQRRLPEDTEFSSEDEELWPPPSADTADPDIAPRDAP